MQIASPTLACSSLAPATFHCCSRAVPVLRIVTAWAPSKALTIRHDARPGKHIPRSASTLRQAGGLDVPVGDMPLLFSYGTLQQESVQRSTFGRTLEGE